MMGLIIAIHVIACVGLIIIVLVQRGRGGGLVESFSGLETMFGTKTNAFLTRATTVFAVVYFLTCLSLTFLSIRQSKSLLRNTKTQQAVTKPSGNEQNTQATTQQAEPIQEPKKAE